MAWACHVALLWHVAPVALACHVTHVASTWRVTQVVYAWHGTEPVRLADGAACIVDGAATHARRTVRVGGVVGWSDYEVLQAPYGEGWQSAYHGPCSM